MATVRVLDSFALLTLLRDEAGAEKVSGILEQAAESGFPVHMTEVNYAEVQYIVRRKDGDAAWEEAAGRLLGAPIEFHAADRALSNLAARFKARFKISLADAYAAALAKQEDGELVTGDPEFKALEREVRIVWTGKRGAA